MGLFPEREPNNPHVEKHAEEIKLPEHLENTGIKAVETAFKATVKDGGQQLITTPQTQAVNITIPKSSTALQTWSEGDIGDGTTWFAMHWLRQVKKAMHFGWKIVWGSNAS